MASILRVLLQGWGSEILGKGEFKKVTKSLAMVDESGGG